MKHSVSLFLLVSFAAALAMLFALLFGFQTAQFAAGSDQDPHGVPTEVAAGSDQDPHGVPKVA